MSERGRPLSAGERDFFEAFFQRLRSEKIAHIFLRNYAGFPERMGNDLDIFFRRDDLDRATALFARLLAESGGKLLHVHQRDYVLAVWFRARAGEKDPIHLDFYHGAFSWHGLSYLSEQELIAGARRTGQFKTPRPAHEALNLSLTSLLWGEFVKSRYQERIQSLVARPEDLGDCDRILKREFNVSARSLLEAFNGSSTKASRALAVQLRRSFKIRSFRRAPFGTLRRAARYWVTEFKTVFAPPGMVVAIMGPDGSGKSTVLQAVKERVEYYFGEIVEYHWRPAFLPDIGILLGRRKKQSGPLTDPHKNSLHSPPASAVRLVYYWLDYWLGYPLRVRKPKAKNHLVLFDRYAPDMWCDSRRYRLRLPVWFTRTLCRFVPRPDLTFVLVGSAETIHGRKKEMPIEELRELLPRYAAAAAANPANRAIDCDRPVSEIADEIASVIGASLAARAKHHPLFH
jgi:thymidylate kinase